ncbi:mariner Mos1 transposase [Trichonephila clavipes]|nr:mariner Mos1 transposase [Trichonephila clavipes]
MEFEKGGTDGRDEERVGPSYSPDCAPSDYHIFGPVKKNLEGKHFRIDAELQQAVLMWLHTLDADFYDTGFDGLVFQWNKNASISMVTIY